MRLPAPRLAPLLMCTLLLGVTACGKKSDNSGATLSADDPNTFTDQQTGETFNVSSDPHPADCDNNKQESPGFTKVDGCSEAVMQAQRVETEGICFVFETVTPTYRHEPPSSGPQFQSPFFFD